MADHFFEQINFTLEKAIVNLWCTFSVGAAGAPTLQKFTPAGAYAAASSAGFRGIKSISRVSTGKYTITLDGTYQRCLGASPTFVVSGTGAAVSMNIIDDTACRNTTPTVQVQFVSAAGAAVDPASGERITINLTFSNSNAP